MSEEAIRVDTDKRNGNLTEDLERYREQALELGANQAAVVNVKDIPVDSRIPNKCRIPRCHGYGSSVHCPPHAPTADEFKALLRDYHWAIFFTRDIPPEVLARGSEDKERIAAFQSIYKIVKGIESKAFYDGHYLAFGLGAGSCKRNFCGKEEYCQALRGGSCRFALLARPSMEAVGIDVYNLVASRGWDIYPFGKGADVATLPKGTLAGIVIVQ